MTAAETTAATDRLRDAQRIIAKFMGGSGLWILIGVGFTYAALFETQLFVIGLIVGSVLALGAMGLTLIYGVLKFGNFAQGDFLMLGAYATFFFMTGNVLGERRDTNVGFGLSELPGATERIGGLSFGYGFLLSVVLSAVVLAVVCVGIDRVVFKRLRSRGSGVVIFSIAGLGLAFAIRALLQIIWGPDPRLYFQGIFKANQYPFDITLKTDQIFIIATALAVTAAVYFLLYRTRLGKSMRAYSDNPDLALVSGINTDRVVTWTWIVAGALAGIAGSLLSLQANLKPEFGFQLLLPLFAAAIVGGLGKPQGALVGGLVVGVAQEVSVAFISSGYKPAVAFVILILILLLRPRGLFGDPQS